MINIKGEGEEAFWAQDDVRFRRLSDVEANARRGYSLWGTDGIGEHHIIQGGFGDCWFLSALAAISTNPRWLNHIFVNDSINDEGIYGVNFFVLGSPITITIDDRLPMAHSDEW